MLTLNSVTIAGVIRRAPHREYLPAEHARCTLQINEGSQYPQMANVVAFERAAEGLMQFSNGDHVVIQGRLSVSMRTDRLRIEVDSVRVAKWESVQCTHRMQIPQVSR